MIESEPMNSFTELRDQLFQDMLKHYWEKIYQYVKKNPQLISQVTGFLLKPKQIIMYLGKTHLGIEYVGSERIDTLPQGKQLNPPKNTSQNLLK